MLKGIVIGIILGVIVLAGGAYYYFASGMAPVATADSMMPFERKMVSMARDAHIEKQHVGESPVAADEPNLLAGADGSRLGMAAKSSNVKQLLASISFARELGACVDSAELGRQIAQSESCLNPGSHANFGPQALSQLSGVSQQFRREASLDSALALIHSASLADYFQFYDSLGGIEYAPNPCGGKPCPTFHAVGPFAFES